MPTPRPTGKRAARAATPGAPFTDDEMKLRPMLAGVGHELPTEAGWAFEPKYDGVRVLAFCAADSVRLVTRNGKEKSTQFPEIAEALRRLVTRQRTRFVLDGEIVAEVHGKPARFQALQRRVHVKDLEAIGELVRGAPVSLVAFDLLAHGKDLLVKEPWLTRRTRLEHLLRGAAAPALILGESISNAGDRMLSKARAAGWEGIMAKQIDAPYLPGVRTDAWLKLKIEFRQEFVVGGWTDPRKTRQHLGAVLVGYYRDKRLIYAGHVGGGFDRKSLRAMRQRLRPLARRSSPFTTEPRGNEPVHWVEPRVVVEVRFNEWTSDGLLRQPIFVGVRDDKSAGAVHREAESIQRSRRNAATRVVRSAASRAGRSATGKKQPAARRRLVGDSRGGTPIDIVAQLELIERDGGSGVLRLGRGKSIDVTSLGKVFFPETGHTKGDLMRHYARVASLIVPTIRGRPLVLKRSPNGVAGEIFYQQKAPDRTPSVVRVAEIDDKDGGTQRRLLGTDLATLIYTVQLGCISVDPWLCRIQSLDFADFAVLDLDPGPGADFPRVVSVALHVKHELNALGLRGAVKTSGSRGLHIFLPLPPKVTFATAELLAQLIAARVARGHPDEATVERSMKSRPPGTVYVDYLQNARGKSVAGVYSVRAQPEPRVSVPIRWSELNGRLDPHAWTVDTLPRRLATVGDIWALETKERNAARAIRDAADHRTV